jgi:transposase-like protein
MKHKTEDYKLSAVKYYLETPNSMDAVCDIFGCSKTSLYRWIEKYKSQHNITRNNRPAISYKITQKQVNDASLTKSNITSNRIRAYYVIMN